MNTKTADLESIYAELMKSIVELNNELERKKQELNDIYKSVLFDFLYVIDAFEQAESTIEERKWNENDIANKTMQRLLTAKKKALSIFEKHGVKPMIFEDSMANDNNCKIIDTEYDAKYPNGYILNIEKKGYLIIKEEKGQVKEEKLRLAEVIVVKK
ncbi:nucleotide exchange factor GrpE [Bacteroidales bacterium OttesenSCG-928-B11]|nr:nucleotide exchange factor GrpE [Bacteroidales bacterium OttesenSCG-928-B11]